jgi:HSP20 family protein
MNWMELRFPEGFNPWRVFGSYLDEPLRFRVSGEDYCPRADIYEGKDRYRIRVELPGLSEDEFKLETHDGIMTLSGEWPERTEESEEPVCREMTAGRFSRSFRLPENVDTEKIEARFEKGILEITLPLKDEEKPKSIKVKVN